MSYRIMPLLRVYKCFYNSRFRLVALTNMDRSPSESSLEKIERTDMIEIISHNAIVMQTKENAEVEKEEAVRIALGKCEEEWRTKLDAEITLLKAKFDTDKQVIVHLGSGSVSLDGYCVTYLHSTGFKKKK